MLNQYLMNIVEYYFLNYLYFHVYIIQPMNRTTFSASGIKGRITELELESANQRTGKSGFGEEFDVSLKYLLLIYFRIGDDALFVH